MGQRLQTEINCENTGRMRNMPIPELAGDSASKSYVDGVASGLIVHAAVKCATTAEITISSPPAVLDGYTFQPGDRVLVKDQTNPVDNGIYYYTSAGVSLNRVSDMANGSNARKVFVFVQNGTVNGASGWVCMAVEFLDIVGTNELPWYQFSYSYLYLPGAALELVGNTLNVRVDGVSIAIDGSNNLAVGNGVKFSSHKYSADVGDGVNLQYDVAHGLNTTDVIVGVRVAATGEAVNCSAVPLDANTVRLTFGAVPASAEYRVVILG